MLSLIVPTYQERENVEPLLLRLSAVHALLPEPLEVVIVDDRSSDETAATARILLDRFHLGCVIERAGPRDLSLAALEGIHQAQGDLIGFMDADLSHPPELLPALVAAVRAGHDVAIASRYVRGGGIVNWPWSRRLASRMANGLARPLVGITDATSGYFVCRRSIFMELQWQPRGYKLLLELLVRGCLHGLEEIPYHFTDRRKGKSKLRGQTLRLFGRQLVALYLHRWAHPCPHRVRADGSRPVHKRRPVPAERVVDPSTRATASGRGLAQDSAPRAFSQVPRALPVGLHAHA